MPERVTVKVNGKEIKVPSETSIAAAVVLAGEWAFRASVTGQPRGALCGMGICFECRGTVNGRPNRRTCQTMVREGMDIQTS